MPRIDRSTPPDTIRGFRHHTGLTQQRLGELLGCTNDAVSGFERDGAPGWMRYALFGIAVKELGMRAEPAAALVGITPPGPLLDRVPAVRAVAEPLPTDYRPGQQEREPDPGDHDETERR